MNKLCVKCGVEKHVRAFSINKYRKDGLQVWCKACFREYWKEYVSRKKVCVEKKVCVKCGVEKSVDMFPLVRKGKLDRRNNCKTCCSDWAREYYRLKKLPWWKKVLKVWL